MSTAIPAIPAERPLLELRGVGKTFGGVAALQDVSFGVAAGTVHALAGENGAGKSTLINILTGVYTEYTGEITLDGQLVRLKGPRDARDRFGIACIHQELSLVPELSVAENIFLGREPRTRWGTVDFARMQTEANTLLARLGLETDARRAVRGLRVGEQQLVEIARALSVDARLLLLDEPTSALSESEITRLLDVLRGLRKAGVTLLYISHKFDELFALADAVTVLRDGRHIATSLIANVDAPTLIGQMAGRPVAELYPKTAVSPGDEALAIEGLSLLPDTNGNGRSLHDVSFALRAGEIVGVAGLMGAGRTELLETLAGAYPSRRVRVKKWALCGKTGSPFASPASALRAGVALVTEDRKQKSLVLSLPIGTNMTLSALAALGRFRRSPVGLLQRSEEREAVQTELERLRVRGARGGGEQAVSRLSGGNQQKVVLAKCLLTRPRVLLLDEPTRGIDVAAKAEIYKLIGELAQEGTAVLLASSELPELLALCDRILVLAEGRLTAEFPRADVTQERLLAAATAAAKSEGATMV